MTSRREFVGTAGIAFIPIKFRKNTYYRPVASPMHSDDIRKIAYIAMEVMRDRGVSYGDIRLTHYRKRMISIDGRLEQEEKLDVGVRSLIDGYWGFSSSPFQSKEEAKRLVEESASQASSNLLEKQRIVNLAPREIVKDGEYYTPVKIDPFELNPDYIGDVINGLEGYVKRRYSRIGISLNDPRFIFQDKTETLGTNDGCLIKQKYNVTQLNASVVLQSKDGKKVGLPLQSMVPSAIGWEYFKREEIYEEVDRIIEELEEDISLPVKPIEVGRYDTVLDGYSIASVVTKTIGEAAEMDRVMGYEANAGGTSYLSPAEEVLGVYQLGSDKLTVQANRSEKKGLGTTGWDSEGVRPKDIVLVQNGVFCNYLTSRESSFWIDTGDEDTESKGYTHSTTAASPPLVFPGNLRVIASNTNKGLSDLLDDIGAGVMIARMGLEIDFMALNGASRGGEMYEIKKGRKTARLINAGTLFRAPEFWKSLVDVGGVKDQIRAPMEGSKGEPPQNWKITVTAPPCVLKNMSIIDVSRKA